MEIVDDHVHLFLEFRPSYSLSRVVQFLKGGSSYRMFKLHPELKKRLLATNNKILVEASPYDNIWGIGISATKAIKMNPVDWPGQNMLGQALMLVRTELQK